MHASELHHAANTLRRHLESPKVSVLNHINDLMAEVRQCIGKRRIIYLDTRYWVFLRDAHLGRAKKPEHERILSLLRDCVASGAAICPMSDVAFMELTTQTDDETRAATAALWDALSLGVALQSEPDRVRTELEHFFSHPNAEDAPRPLHDIVWVKACFVLGAIVPDNDKVSAELNRAVQKSCIDTLWSMSFAEMAKSSAADLAAKEKFERTAAQINVDMRRFQHKVPSFEKTFLAEISGALSANKKSVSQVVADLYGKQGYSLDGVTAEQLQAFQTKMLNVLVNAFRYARQKMAHRLPSLYLHALCHAAIRMDIKRKLNGNFLRDLHHGTAGVAYHDAVFTERPLRVLLTAGNVAADKTFDCRIMFDESDVLQYLKSLSVDCPNRSAAPGL